MATDPVDWSVPEAAIETRLDALRQGGLVRKLMTAADMAAIEEATQVTPAVYVVYMGVKVPDADAARAAYQHEWVVVTAVQQAVPTPETQGRHRLASPIVARVSELLHGWRPADGFGELVPMTPPPVAYSALGFAYVPLRFKTTAWGAAQGGARARPR